MRLLTYQTGLILTNLINSDDIPEKVFLSLYHREHLLMKYLCCKTSFLQSKFTIFVCFVIVHGNQIGNSNKKNVLWGG